MYKHTYDPETQLLRIYQREMKKYFHKKTHKTIHNSFIHYSQKLEAIQVSNNRMDKLLYIYTMEYYVAKKQKEQTSDRLNNVDAPQKHSE